MPRRDSKTASFEQLYQELEATVEKLESGNLPLDEALALFERGMLLAQECSALLDRAELRIQELAPGAELTDEFSELENFSDQEHDE